MNASSPIAHSPPLYHEGDYTQSGWDQEKAPVQHLHARMVPQSRFVPSIQLLNSNRPTEMLGNPAPQLALRQILDKTTVRQDRVKVDLSSGGGCGIVMWVTPRAARTCRANVKENASRFSRLIRAR